MWLEACEPARYLTSIVALAGKRGFLKLYVEGVTGVRGAVVGLERCVRPACFVGVRGHFNELGGEGNILAICRCA
jgi:hypothetical protein